MDEFRKDPNNNENKKSYWINMKKGLEKIFAKDGFYIILFICICLVGTTAVWVSTNNVKNSQQAQGNENQAVDIVQDPMSENEMIKKLTTLYESSKTKDNQINDQETKDESSVEVVNIEDTSKSSQTKENTQLQGNEAQKTNDSTNKNQSTPANSQSRAVSMTMPLQGTISMDFARDKLVFSKTLEQWTTHNGIDIRAREGSVIRASLDGVVQSIKQDQELGIIITLDHGDGLISRYACVSTDEMVEVGQRISKGDPISGVGKAMGFEVAQGPHLHFEVLKNGEYVDPKQYLPVLK
ncbi:M23 family metallopeptidase [Sporosalibacterium faouarense]|uniref:M23 family metallopeptidase n=1 Tax=Sporosalibacterium faouarense TaxID=516123 RepID=UPI00141C2EBF|nr:M23 family metallopeptidase [Sporosalibacterium faouarense]MTI46856.1 M23 family metallopeptidase [Bacillota bacterium]